MNGFDILALGLTSIGCFLVGYYTGVGKSPKELIKEIQIELKKRNTPVGPVNRPSPEKVIQFGNKQQQEEDEAFKESFLKEHPEVKELYERQNG
jgi:hypothetical protein